MMNLNKILAAVLAAVAVTIIAVSAVFISKGNGQPAVQNTASFSAKKMPAFTKIGQLRTVTKPDSSGKTTVIIITPVLEYQSEDKSFYEELDRKTKKIRDLITDYFNSKTVEQINSKGELQIKAELLDSINSLLVLQQIKNLYFSEYQFL